MERGKSTEATMECILHFDFIGSILSEVGKPIYSSFRAQPFKILLLIRLEDCLQLNLFSMIKVAQ